MSGKKKHHSRPHVDGYMSAAFRAEVKQDGDIRTYLDADGEPVAAKKVKDYAGE